MNVLIVEDSPTQRDMLAHTLSQNGYTVTAAANGREALERLKADKPVMVISDVLMPEMDGFSLCRSLKTQPEFADVPVVLLTALTDPKDVLAGLECGADNFIGKPFADDYLLSRLQSVLANKDLRRREKETGVELQHDGQKYLITAGRRQILDLLLSVYEAAVRRNRELVNAEQELRATNADLENKVASRTAKLVQTNKSLEAFCYSIAHDLRTPLRSIQGFMAIVSEEYAAQLDAKGRDYVKRSSAAAERMDRLIQDLLAFGRISHAEAPAEWLDCQTEARAVVELFARAIEERGATVRVTAPRVQVWANRTLFREALSNLIGNSLKFVRRGVAPDITISARLMAGHAEVAVEDNGIGIAKQYFEKAFRIFERVHTEGDFPGNGIGLAIVHKAVERMGGTVQVESWPGRGSRFAIRLPWQRTDSGALNGSSVAATTE